MRIEWFLIWTNLIPFTQGCILPSLVEIDQVVLEKIFKELGPRRAKLVMVICLKMNMVEYV